MKASTVIGIACVAAVCWMASVLPAEACSCSPPGTREAFERAVAVFEGTVVDQRITLVRDLSLYGSEQDIAVGRVWKGVATNRVSVVYLEHGMCSGAAPVGVKVLLFMMQKGGRLAYGLCHSGQSIADAAPALDVLGPPIATFDDQVPVMRSGPASLSLTRRLASYVATAVSYSVNLDRLREHQEWLRSRDTPGVRLLSPPPAQVNPGLVLGLVVLLMIAAAVFVLVPGRFRRVSLVLGATSATAVVALVLWTGHELASRPDIVDALFYY